MSGTHGSIPDLKRQIGSPVGGVGSPGRAQIAERTLRTTAGGCSPLVTFTLLVDLAALRAGPDRHRSATTSSRSTTTSRRSTRPASPPPASPKPATSGRGSVSSRRSCRYALLVLPFLLGFRLTCYYYRKAYYRSFWLSPPACAVAEPHAEVHRRDAVPADPAERRTATSSTSRSSSRSINTLRRDPRPSTARTAASASASAPHHARQRRLPLALHGCRATPAATSSAAGCKHFSKHPVRYWAWTIVSRLNTRHMELAWITLGTLMVTDAYIALVASGVLTDLRFVN